MRVLACLFILLGATALRGELPPSTMSTGEILHQLRSFASTGRVLYVAAHPDDENTRLIAYLARERGYQTGYLSLTRGDGGQNLIGSELRDALGLIRTRELLAARRVDGGVQFFSRANDFGFSKSAEETLALWGRDEILRDMVQVLRTFRPDVVITRFSPEPGGTHGHHTASAQLAMEAFARAADPEAFAAELGHLPTWKPKRVVWNAWVGRGGLTAEGMLSLDVGGYDPLVGESFGEIAARSRTMHKSQGFGAVGSRGTATEYFRHLTGEPAQVDVMDGVDTSWRRLTEADDIDRAVASIIRGFQPLQPAASVPALFGLHRQLHALPHTPDLAVKQRQLDAIIASCLGLHVETTIAHAEALPGSTLELRHASIVRAEVPVRWTAPTREERALPFNQTTTVTEQFAVPSTAALSQPYWLQEPGAPGLFKVSDPTLIGRPINPPAWTGLHQFQIGGADGVVITLESKAEQVIDDPVRGEIREPLRIVPPVTVEFAKPLELFAPGETKTVAVQILSTHALDQARAGIALPAGWTMTSEAQPIGGLTTGQAVHVAFQVTAPSSPAVGELQAYVEVPGRRYATRRSEIRYEHIPRIVLQPPATMRAMVADVKVSGRRIGYLPGAGDLVPDALRLMGCTVVPLTADQLDDARLAGLDAVVLGIRALNTQANLGARLPALFRYAEQGGTVIVQYNTTNELPGSAIGPYPLRLSRDRVTDEKSAVQVLAPQHPVMRHPNAIAPTDFAGWVQERGLYFAGEWDSAYTPIIAAADPGEAPLAGGLLVARHGQGWYVYTGISFFRQLPDGVPGAYRLFANLISLSHAR